MLILIALLTTGYLGYLLWEKWANDRALKSFRHIIHVNGIRGKTGTCRLIDAHLRGAGFRVFTKTTGSTPCYIGVDGTEHRIRRLGNANIGEQLRVIRKAYRQGAEVLIIECMAVQPELQNFAQHHMVKGNLNVITNVRYDHIFEMGESLEEIADSLSHTIPENGVLFTSDETFFPFFRDKAREKNTEVILCRENEFAKTENEAIACALGEKIGISADSFPCHIAYYQEDFGAHRLYRTEEGTFLNLFSANDPQSTKKLLDQFFPDSSDAVLLYNNRTDRPERLLLFLRHFFPEVPCKKIIVMGEARALALRHLKKNGFSHVESASTWQEAVSLADSAPLVGIGNIKGQAYDMINHYEGGEQN